MNRSGRAPVGSKSISVKKGSKEEGGRGRAREGKECSSLSPEFLETSNPSTPSSESENGKAVALCPPTWDNDGANAGPSLPPALQQGDGKKLLAHG